MKKYIYTFLALVLVSTFWYSCTPPLEGITLQLPQSIAKSNVIIEFKPDNAAAGDLPKDLTIRIGGQDSSKVVNITGGKTFKIKQNFLTLAANPSITPSKNSPIKFSIIVEAEGYLRSITPVEITSTEDQVLRVELTKISAPPTGITVMQQTSTIPSSGTTSTAIAVSTPVNNDIAEKSTITIPSGIKFTDEKGVEVGGNVNIVVSKADASKTDVVVDYRGISKIVDKNNNVIPNFKVTPIVGIEVEMTNDNSQKVKSFSGQIEIKAEIPATAKNTKTGKALQEGDVVLITSFDEDTKVYKYEGSSTLVKNANGKLEAKASVNHLTQFFISDYSGLIIEGKNPTNGEIQLAKRIFGVPIDDTSFGDIFTYFNILIEGEVEKYPGYQHGIKVVLEFSDPDISVFYITGVGGVRYFEGIDVYDRRGIQLPERLSNYRWNGPKKIKLFDLFDNLLATSPDYPFMNQISSGDKGYNLYVTMTLPSPPNYIQIIADLKCNGTKKNTIQRVSVSAKPSGTSTKNYSFLGSSDKDVNGIMQLSTFQLKRGGKYDFMFFIGGIAFYYDNQTITNGPIHKVTSTLPDTFCK